MASSCEASLGMDWGPPGTGLIFSGVSQPLIHFLQEGENESRRVTELDSVDGEIRHVWPTFLNEEWILFTAIRRNRPSKVYALSLESREKKFLYEFDGTYAEVLESGHLVFIRRGDLYAVRFDHDRLEVMSGLPVRVLQGVNHSVNTTYSDRWKLSVEWRETGAAQFTVSSTGHLVYAPDGIFPSEQNWPVLLDETCNEETIGEDFPRFIESNPQTGHVSPDGNSILFQSLDGSVWYYDLARRVPEIQIFDVAPSRFEQPVWGPGPGEFTFRSRDETGKVQFWVRRIRADVSQASVPLELPAEYAQRVVQMQWSPSADHLAVVETFTEETDVGSRDIWLWRLGEELEPFRVTTDREAFPRFHPSGAWLSYSANISPWNLYILPVAGADVALPKSVSSSSLVEEGSHSWSYDGSHLFLVEKRVGLFLVPFAIRPDGKLELGDAKKICDQTWAGGLISPVSTRDGRHLLFRIDPQEILQSATKFFPDRLHLVSNWFTQLNQQVP